VILWVVAIVVFGLDRLSKHAIVTSLAPGESRVAVPHLLWWTYSQNTSGAFGLFGDSPILLIALALAVLAFFAYAFRDGARTSRLVRIAFGMIVGGAAGNIADRVHQRYVVDFIDFKPIWPEIFNVADSCIMVGAALVAIGLTLPKGSLARLGGFFHHPVKPPSL
jgi:signal peptidase II